MDIFKLVGSIFVDTNKANESLQKTDKKAESLGSRFLKTAGSVGKFTLKAGAAIGGFATAAGTAIVSVTEQTREYRNEMGKLETAFLSSGKTSQEAKTTYQELNGILGDSGQAVEAAAHLAELTTTQEELSNWTNICAGVYGKFGASLPIEGLTEAANETAKTGALTGGLADALNWAGVNEEKFQEQLDSLNNEQDRAALITSTLTELYGEAGETYKDVNKDVIEANKSQDRLNGTMAKIGGALEPVVNKVKGSVASLAESALPTVEKLTTFLVEKLMPGAEKVFERIGTAIETYAIPAFTFITDNVLPKASEAFGYVKEMIQTYVTPAISGIGSYIEIVAAKFMEYMPVIQETFGNAVTWVVSCWNEHLLPCFTAIKDFIENVLVPAFVWVFENVIQPIVKNVFENIGDLWEKSLKPILENVIDFITNVFSGDFTGAFENISEILGGIFEGIKTVIKTAVNAVVDIMNNFIRGLNKLKIPDWVPGVGGKGINIPEIPMLAKGGNVVGAGTVLVGERGPELLDLPVGAKVTPLNGSNGSEMQQVVTILGTIVDLIRKTAGKVDFDNLGVYLDTGALVGGIAPAMDGSLGTIATHKGRRN